MKSEKAWMADEQKLKELKEWRAELRLCLADTSRQIHILATSINQHKKKGRN